MFFKSLINKSLRLCPSVTANSRLQPSAQQCSEPPATPRKVPEFLSFNEIQLQLMLNSAGLLTVAISKEMGWPPLSGGTRRALGTVQGG